jgi:hypothetical protein
MAVAVPTLVHFLIVLLIELVEQVVEPPVL